MKYFQPTHYTCHDPKYDYSDGLPPFEHIESVKRYEQILKGVMKVSKPNEIQKIDKFIKLKKLYTIHDKKYIKFLVNLCKVLEEDKDFLPSMFRNDLSLANIKFQSGMYCKEIGTPLQKHSIKAILNSAKVALKAAKYTYKHDEIVFALTRPPGHHSGHKSYAGYCYVNNCFLGAKYLLDKGLKPIILDIDYHIGDGTAELSQKFGVHYFSTHVNAFKNYPYLSKESDFGEFVHESEIKPNTSFKKYLKQLKVLLKDINAQKPDVFLLSLGFDTLQGDLGQDLKVEFDPQNFYEIAKLIKEKIGCKILIYLEGGYNTQKLSESVEYFLQGMNE